MRRASMPIFPAPSGCLCCTRSAAKTNEWIRQTPALRRRAPRAETSHRNDRREERLPLAESLIGEHARRLHEIVEDRFFACENLDGCHHARDDRQWVLLRTKIVFIRANDHPIKTLGL